MTRATYRAWKCRQGVHRWRHWACRDCRYFQPITFKGIPVPEGMSVFFVNIARAYAIREGDERKSAVIVNLAAQGDTP